MAEGGRSKGEDGRADLSVRDDLYTEDICKPRPESQKVSG